MPCSIFIYSCSAPQYVSYSVMNKNSLRSHLRITGFESGEVETARQATPAINAENNKGLGKAAALCCKELTLDEFSASSYLFLCWIFQEPE